MSNLSGLNTLVDRPQKTFRRRGFESERGPPPTHTLFTLGPWPDASVGQVRTMDGSS